MPRASCLALGPDTPLSSRQLHSRPLHPYGRPAHLARARPAHRPSAYATTADLAISPHPDALIRRQQAEERQRKRREQVAKAGKNGLKWWQAGAPSNVQYVNSVEQMQDALEVLKGRDGLAFIDFYATHCVACKTMYPKLRQIAERNPDATFFKVNAGEDGLRPYCESIGVHKVPYFHVYKAGVLVSEFSANLSTINRVRGELKLHQQQ